MATQLASTAPLLVTVTPNPAIDITHIVDKFQLGGTNRVTSVLRHAGGKGVNVARIAAQLGAAVEVRGFLGGANGSTLSKLLTDAPVTQFFERIDGETRLTVTVTDGRSATLLNEPGPEVSDNDWKRLTDGTVERLTPGSVVVVSGSFPPGTTSTHVADLIIATHRARGRVIVDTSGPLLKTAARAGADILKPNRDELIETTGFDDPVQGATLLLSLGAKAVVVSWGKSGLFLITEMQGKRRVWHATPPEVLGGNPTGAGDAAVAAFALAMLETPDKQLSAHLVKAAALSAAAVLMRAAGQVDLMAFEGLISRTTMEELNDPR